MATKAPDENDRARGIGPPLPRHPGDDAVPMPDPAAEAAAKAKADADAQREAERAARRAALEAQRVGALMPEALRRMEARASGTETPVPVPWKGMADALGGGLWPGCYTVVGNTGSGKSQFAIQIGYEAAVKGVPVLYVGLELAGLDLVARLIGLAAKVSWSKLFLGDAFTVDGLRDRHAATVEGLRSLPFHLEFGGPFGWSYTELEAKVRDMRDLYPEPNGKGSRPMLVVLDFLQLVAGTEAGEDIRERIAKASYAARAVARAMDVAVLLVSSTARENYATLDGAKSGTGGTGHALGEGSPRRLVGVGKESGEIEYACDAALVLAREPEERGPTLATPITWLAVAKGRAVVPSWVKLTFDGSAFSEPTSKPGRRVDM
jgi:KaiC/GvpD/RAD55 family RecA-like ATPase